MINGEWLDPPVQKHTEHDCVQGRPQITRADLGRRWKCATCKRIFQAYDTGDQRDPYWWREVPVHSAQQVDGYPLCQTMEYWENAEHFTATMHDNEVTCAECKVILKRMKDEIGY